MAVEMTKGGMADSDGSPGTMNVDTAGVLGRGRARARNYPCGLFLAVLSSAARPWAAVAHAVAAD